MRTQLLTGLFAGSVTMMAVNAGCGGGATTTGSGGSGGGDATTSTTVTTSTTATTATTSTTATTATTGTGGMEADGHSFDGALPLEIDTPFDGDL
ncbi:MAG: hypothetical protein ABI193_25710, partial [Minicystis sp.]